MESTDSSSAGSQHPHLPPGFRFHPTDEELVVHYLKKKLASVPLPVMIIAEIDLYKFDPWELPSKAAFGEQEWYFFSPRDRKYPNGARPNRAATSGYWKATGTDKPILTSNGTQKVGVKKALVFYGGKPPKGIKTNWIMHEYRLVDDSLRSKQPPVSDLGSKKGSLRLDDWVLCRIYKKNNSQRPMERDKEDCMEEMLASSMAAAEGHQQMDHPKPPASSKPTNYTSLLDNDDNFFEGILTGGDHHHHHHHQAMQSSSISPQKQQLASSSSKPSSMSMASPNSTAANNNIPSKRLLQSQYWNDQTGVLVGTSSTGKRFHSDNNSSSMAGTSDGNSSFVSLLNQLPQSTSTTPFNANALLGSLGDGVFRQPYQLPGMNWNS